MVPSGPPTFFVISAQGESGPYDRAGLRAALADGTISARDQVRTAFGSPLGSVQRVLARDSDRPAVPPAPPQPEPPRSGANHLMLLGAGLVVVLGLLALLGVGRSGAPERTGAPPAPAITPPTPMPKPAPAPVPAPPQETAPAPLPVPLKPPPEPAPPPAPAPALSGNLLQGVNVMRWGRGKDMRVTLKMGGVLLEQNGSAMWAGVPIPKERQDWRGSRGLLLNVQAVDRACAMWFELNEGSGERHVAPFRLEPGAGAQEIRLPWASFRRRDDQMGRNPPDDGLQLDRIGYVALWPEGDGAVSYRIHSLRLDR